MVTCGCQGNIHIPEVYIHTNPRQCNNVQFNTSSKYRIWDQNNMDSIAKTVFTNKLNSVTDSVNKNFNFGDEKDDKDEDRQLTSKELRKLEEQDKAERAKREEHYAKRNEERQKKREAIRAKYGLSNEKESGERRPSQGKADNSKTTEDKSCVVM
jgi:hypothetical protein